MYGNKWGSSSFIIIRFTLWWFFQFAAARYWHILIWNRNRLNHLPNHSGRAWPNHCNQTIVINANQNDYHQNRRVWNKATQKKYFDLKSRHIQCAVLRIQLWCLIFVWNVWGHKLPSREVFLHLYMDINLKIIRVISDIYTYRMSQLLCDLILDLFQIFW